MSEVKIKMINGCTVYVMEGILKRNGNELHFINDSNTDYIVDKIMKVDKNKDILVSRYLLISENIYIQFNSKRQLNLESLCAINGMSKLKKGTSHTNMIDLF